MLCIAIKKRLGKLANSVEVISVTFSEPYPSAQEVVPHFKVVVVGPIAKERLEYETFLMRWQNHPRLQPVEYLAEELIDELKRYLIHPAYDMSKRCHKFSEMVAALRERKPSAA